MFDPVNWWESLPADLKNSFWGFVWTVVAAFVGRLMFHVGQVQQQKRRFWSRHLAWELSTAVGIGLIGEGVASYFGLSGPPATGVIVGIAYIGPRGLEYYFIQAVSAYRARGAAK